MMKRKFCAQFDSFDCGPACLSMISSFYGKDYDLKFLRNKSFLNRKGVSIQGICEAANTIGLENRSAKLTLALLSSKDGGAILPCILHWNQNHFVVLYKVSTSIITGKKTYKIADPAYGFVSLSEDKFKKGWISHHDKGVALFLCPTDEFYAKTIPSEEKLSLGYLLKYLIPYKQKLFWMFCLLLLGTLTTLVFPVLTQKLIDDGVNKKDINLVGYILAAQLAFFLGNIVFGIFRNWIVLEVGTRINIRIISDFLKKILRLPINFFDTKLTGDFNQRIQDHERIEYFLTSQSLLTLFSVITFSVFFGFLWYYDYRILLVYLVLTAVSVAWSLYWMRKRKFLDYFRFQQKSESQEAIFEIINGVSEMKLNQYETYKRTKWELIQEKLLGINIRILKLDQSQLSGFEFINQFKNILVTFLAAALVIQNQMTLGALLSVSYIIGQMNSPISQLINFLRSLQDARLSLTRLNEVQNDPEEELPDQVSLTDEKYTKQNGIQRGIYFKKIAFQYEGPQSPYVLKNIDLFIPEGKITAIVGASGSGKTTLMKLLLKFYHPVDGEISFNHLNIKDISPLELRKNCGVVMQDGFIFSDTIERNVATSDETGDVHKMERALRIANIQSYIDELPLGLDTKIGASGNGLSGGQRQRVLIARAVYKDPHYVFFDEATSALDAENEKIIHNNLQSFFKGKTVVIIAHRLSTVKNADQIIVLKRGQIVETGTHQELVGKKDEYYNLVKNQLELGN